MPTVQDEEESLCLLAADLQDLPPRDQMVPNAANTNWTTNDDDDEDEEVSPRLPIYLQFCKFFFFGVAKL